MNKNLHQATLDHTRYDEITDCVGFFENANSGNFEIANYMQIGRFLTVLWGFLQKQLCHFWNNIRNHVFCKNHYKTVKNRRLPPFDPPLRRVGTS